MKKLFIVLVVIISMVSISNAAPLKPSLGMELEVRGGGYMTISPENAKNMFGNGYLIGGSIRKSIFPLIKIGLSVDMIKSSQDSIKEADLSESMSSAVDTTNENIDVEYNMVPICAEIMVEPPILPLYAHAGVGMYRSKITAEISGQGEVYNESDTKLGGFIGAGTKLGLPFIPISFRAGAKYHILKVKETALEDSMKAISVEAGVRIKL